jgi:hypothetical protein
MSTLVAQTISNGTVSTSSANVIQGSAKAWVNFVGSSGAISVSYNVSSITRVGAGQYGVNFTTAMPTASYAIGLSSNDNGAGAAALCAVSSVSTTTLNIITFKPSTLALGDASYVGVIVCGN